MGQQQLLIVVLVTILIGIATIVAISTLEDARIQSNQELIRQKMVEAGNLAQAYYRKSSMMGGGSRSFSNIDLEIVELASDSTIATFSLESITAQSFDIVAEPIFGEENIIITIFPETFEFQE